MTVAVMVIGGVMMGVMTNLVLTELKKLTSFSFGAFYPQWPQWEALNLVLYEF